MIHIFLIIFRELLEILLILGMIIALSKEHIPGFAKSLTSGCIIGIVGAVIIALIAPNFAILFEGLEQEIMASLINFITAFLIGLTVTYLPAQSKITMQKFRSHIAASPNDTQKKQTIFISLVALTILREGAEIVLLSSGIIFSKNISLFDFCIGALLGFLAAGFCGILFYLGFAKITRIFRWTAVIFTLIAASLVAEACGVLTRSGILSFLSEPAWDSSWAISDTGLVGQFLKILINYNSNPSILEVISFIVAFIIISFISMVFKRNV